jgi:hypothetical protein
MFEEDAVVRNDARLDEATERVDWSLLCSCECMVINNTITVHHNHGMVVNQVFLK